MLLRCESLEPAMSEMGHNQHSPSTAHCPLYPAADMRQRQPWAAMCQKET